MFRGAHKRLYEVVFAAVAGLGVLIARRPVSPDVSFPHNEAVEVEVEGLARMQANPQSGVAPSPADVATGVEGPFTATNLRAPAETNSRVSRPSDAESLRAAARAKASLTAAEDRAVDKQGRAAADSSYGQILDYVHQRTGGEMASITASAIFLNIVSFFAVKVIEELEKRSVSGAADGCLRRLRQIMDALGYEREGKDRDRNESLEVRQAKALESIARSLDELTHRGKASQLVASSTGSNPYAGAAGISFVHDLSRTVRRGTWSPEEVGMSFAAGKTATKDAITSILGIGAPSESVANLGAEVLAALSLSELVSDQRRSLFKAVRSTTGAAT